MYSKITFNIAETKITFTGYEVLYVFKKLVKQHQSAIDYADQEFCPDYLTLQRAIKERHEKTIDPLLHAYDAHYKLSKGRISYFLEVVADPDWFGAQIREEVQSRLNTISKPAQSLFGSESIDFAQFLLPNRIRGMHNWKEWQQLNRLLVEQKACEYLLLNQGMSYVDQKAVKQQRTIVFEKRQQQFFVHYSEDRETILAWEVNVRENIASVVGIAKLLRSFPGGKTIRFSRKNCGNCVIKRHD